MKVAIFVPHLGYLKHFEHLIPDSKSSTEKLTVFYYQRKLDFEGNYRKNRNIDLQFLNQKSLIEDKEAFRLIELLNSLKNSQYWQLSDFKKFPELARRFRIRPALSGSQNRISKILLSIVSENKTDEMVWHSCLEISKQIENIELRNSKFKKLLKRQNIEILILSPYLDGDWQPIAAALICRRLNILTVANMASWDNFENKGLAHPSPDYFLCWSNYHKEILVQHHKVDPDKIVIVGSYIFDNWFKHERSRTNLPPLPTINIIYFCSSPFITGKNEFLIIERFIRILGKLSNFHFKVDIRPHPQNRIEIENIEKLGTQANVDLSLNEGNLSGSKSALSRSTFVNEMENYDIAVGVNTSILLESCAIGMPFATLDAHSLGVRIPKTRHIKFLRKFETTHFANENSILDFLRDIDKDDLIKIGNEKKNQLKLTFSPEDVNFLENYLDVLSSLNSSPIHYKNPSSGTPSTPLKIIHLKSIKYRNLKRGIVILIRLGFKDFFLHLKLFLSNKELEFSPKVVNDLQSKEFVLENGASFRLVHLSGHKIKFQNDQQYAAYVDQLVKDLMNEIQSADKIYFGPWYSELGFELLYAIPFLNFLKKQLSSQTNFIAISRGGDIPLYGEVGIENVNALRYFDKDEWEKITTENWRILGGLKQSALTSIDLKILERVLLQEDDKSESHIILHPSMIFAIFRPYWRGNVSIESILKYLDFPITQGPEKKINNRVFVKLYSRPSLEASILEIDKVIESLADFRKKDFLICNQQEYSDDHELFMNEIGKFANFRSFAANNFEDNLHIQLDLMKSCSQSVVTYGGLSYFPLFFGNDSVGIFQDSTKFAKCHLSLAEHLAQKSGSIFRILHISEIDSLRKIPGWD